MTVCLDSEHTHEHKCKIPEKVSTWTVHGLWPTHGSTEGPSFCNNASKFNPDEIADIRDQLDVFWPNLYTDTPDDGFWVHEWSKHGTCCQTAEAVNTQRKYFSKGLELRQQFDILSILAKGGIVPSDTTNYKPSQFQNVLGGVLGLKPQLFCLQDEGKQYLMEIWFCVDKSFEVMNCPHKASPRMEWESSDNLEQLDPHHHHHNHHDRVFSMVQKSQFVTRKSKYNPHCHQNSSVIFPVIKH